MAAKKDICPFCKAYLECNTSTRKLTCPNSYQGCSFIDRRFGSSVVDPAFERRDNSHDDWKMRYRKEA